MSDKLKKIILVLAFIGLAILIGILIYYLFFRPFITPTPTEGTPTPSINALPGVPSANIPPILPPDLNALPNINLPTNIPPVPPTIPGPEISPTASGGLTSYAILETTASKDLSLSNNGTDLIYYNKDTGFFYRITPNGEKKLYSDLPFKNVETVTWSPNNQKAVLEYPDGSNVIYDFKDKKSVTLPAQWTDFTFSNDSAQIAFKDLRLDPENRYISVSNTDGTGFRKIEQLGDNESFVSMTWSPNDKYVALYREPLDMDRSTVYPIGFNNENYRSFTIEGRDLRFAWKPKGDQLLYSVYNSQSDFNPSLWIVNTDPKLLATGRRNLEIKTWADKCSFASETIVYCAVPQKLETGMGLSPGLADSVPDDIYKIDIQTGTKKLIAEPLYSTTIQQIIISEDGKYLYWLDKNTGQINKMDL